MEISETTQSRHYIFNLPRHNQPVHARSHVIALRNVCPRIDVSDLDVCIFVYLHGQH